MDSDKFAISHRATVDFFHCRVRRSNKASGHGCIGGRGAVLCCTKEDGRREVASLAARGPGRRRTGCPQLPMAMRQCSTEPTPSYLLVPEFQLSRACIYNWDLASWSIGKGIFNCFHDIVVGRVDAEAMTVDPLSTQKLFSFAQAYPSFSQTPPWIHTLWILSNEESITIHI